MKQIIGRLLITQKGQTPTSITFVDDITIEAQIKNKEGYISVYNHQVDRFLRHLRFMEDFINLNKVDEELKDWRR